MNRAERKHPIRTRFRPEDTRDSYDKVARQYADDIADELDHKQFDREWLAEFARWVDGSNGGLVVELGCGPGHVANFLAGRGFQVWGLDISPQMVAEAQRLFPDLHFVVGDMLKLPFGDATLSGLVAFYSIIHFDDDQLAQVFKEMARVLEPAGLVTLAFHVGNDIVHVDDWHGQPVSMDTRSMPREHVVTLLRRAGFQLILSEERDPYPPEAEYQSRRAYITARRVAR